MFVNEEYDNYKYIVNYSDNYVVLTNQRSVNGSWDRPEEIDTIIQYFYPSYITLENSQTFSTTRVFQEVEVSSDYWDRPDVPFLLGSSFIIVVLICYVINQVTEFITKGGLFH